MKAWFQSQNSKDRQNILSKVFCDYWTISLSYQHLIGNYRASTSHTATHPVKVASKSTTLIQSVCCFRVVKSNYLNWSYFLTVEFVWCKTTICLKLTLYWSTDVFIGDIQTRNAKIHLELKVKWPPFFQYSWSITMTQMSENLNDRDCIYNWNEGNKWHSCKTFQKQNCINFLKIC